MSAPALPNPTIIHLNIGRFSSVCRQFDPEWEATYLERGLLGFGEEHEHDPGDHEDDQEGAESSWERLCQIGVRSNW